MITIIPVLLYHRIIDPDDPIFDEYCVSRGKFESQMLWLSVNGYKSLSLSEFIHHQKNDRPLPEKRFLLTFDDGYQDNFTMAYPILQKYQFTATIFLISGACNKKGNTKLPVFLSINEIKKMQKSGFDFQSHGQTHRVLTEMALSEAKKEIRNSKIDLENDVWKITYFTYPLGRFNPEIKNEVILAGYSGAFGGQPNLNGRVSDFFSIGRTEILESDSLRQFQFKVQTGFNRKLYLIKMLGRLKRKIALTFNKGADL